MFEKFDGSVTNGYKLTIGAQNFLTYKGSWRVEWIKVYGDGLDTREERMSTVWLEGS